MKSLARVGFGLDAQHAGRYPSGIEGLVERFRPRLSHLSVVSLEDIESARYFRAECARGLPIIHHLSGVAPADPDGPHLDRLAALNPITKELDAIWCGEDIGLWTIGPYAIPYFAPPLFERELAEQIGTRIRDVQRQGVVPFLAEVPSCTIALGTMDLGTFFHHITDRGGCDMVLDVSHVYSYALLMGRDPEHVLSSLPLERACEAHVAGGHVHPEHPRRYVDTHSDPILPEVLALLTQAAGRCPRLQAVTYEIGVGLSSNDIAAGLDAIEAALEQARWEPGLERPRA